LHNTASLLHDVVLVWVETETRCILFILSECHNVAFVWSFTCRYFVYWSSIFRSRIFSRALTSRVSCYSSSGGVNASWRLTNVMTTDDLLTFSRQRRLFDHSVNVYVQIAPASTITFRQLTPILDYMALGRAHIQCRCRQATGAPTLTLTRA